MEISIFARTFDGDHVEQLLDAVAAYGLRCVHFNLKCAGVPTLPDTIDTAFCHRIREAFEQRGMKMVALAAHLPRARFVQISSKSESPQRHVDEFRRHLSQFLNSLEPRWSLSDG